MVLTPCQPPHLVLQVLLIPGVKILQCCNSITFVNVYSLKHKLLKEVRVRQAPLTPWGPLSTTCPRCDPSCVPQVSMVKIPLKEEEIFTLFNESYTSLSENKICRCFCDCEELEPETRVSLSCPPASPPSSSKDRRPFPLQGHSPFHTHECTHRMQ